MWLIAAGQLAHLTHCILQWPQVSWCYWPTVFSTVAADQLVLLTHCVLNSYSRSVGLTDPLCSQEFHQVGWSYWPTLFSTVAAKSKSVCSQQLVIMTHCVLNNYSKSFSPHHPLYSQQLLQSQLVRMTHCVLNNYNKSVCPHDPMCF